MNISEITGMDENVISMQDIFTFVKKGIGPNGKVVGTFQPSRHPAEVPGAHYASRALILPPDCLKVRWK